MIRTLLQIILKNFSIDKINIVHRIKIFRFASRECFNPTILINN